MKKFNLLFILLTTIFQSCNNDDCGDCFTPPEAFRFEIVDKTSGENLFTNGTYKPEQIQITNTSKNSKAEFTFISENNINLIQIGFIGWETEVVNLKIDILNTQIFNLYVDAERKKEDCCSYTEYKEISISDSEFEFDKQTGIYKILLE